LSNELETFIRPFMETLIQYGVGPCLILLVFFGALWACDLI